MRDDERLEQMARVLAHADLASEEALQALQRAAETLRGAAQLLRDQHAEEEVRTALDSVQKNLERWGVSDTLLQRMHHTLELWLPPLISDE